MKKVLIIYPHFPPSNLAGVHRPRLFAKHLKSFGWEPVILTVHEKHYEENPDWNLVKLLAKDLRIEKVDAFKNTKPRLIGDIGLRAFFHLYKKAKSLLKNEQFDFVYIPIPSFYVALLGRMLYRKTGVPYGIDYIDPWVHKFPGSDKKFSRHWMSMKLANFLEPIAIKNASLITGVAEGYYRSVLERNPNLKVVSGAMPYGGEKDDHEKAEQLNLQPYLFSKNEDKFIFIYAGAMLPKAYEPLERIFRSIAKQPEQYRNVEFHFIGTGYAATNPESYNIKPLAQKYALWNSIIFEYPQRIPYLDVLTHLTIADGIFILGSTEPHYTPSKTYQGVLSKKPLMAVLHSASTAVNVVRESNAGLVLDFNGEEDLDKLSNEFNSFFLEWEDFSNNFKSENVRMTLFEQYSAKSVTNTLADLMNEAISIK